MAIRNAAKAIILHDNKILVNRCRIKETDEVYYDLPGGGQQQFETMEAAVIREVMEETGYKIDVIRFVGLAEEIYLDEAVRKKYVDYSHRISHIFLAKLADDKRLQPSETDFQQEESVWLNLHDANSVPFQPKSLTGNIEKIVRDMHPVYLGCEYI